jgi:hypothetical protein
MAKKGIQQEAVFPVYKINSYGVNVECTSDRSDATKVYNELSYEAEFWEVQADGSAKLLKRKL